MPFDNPNNSPAFIDEIEIVDRVKHRIRLPQLWCKHDLARGGRRCLLGALNEADHGDYYSQDFALPASSTVLLKLTNILCFQRRGDPTDEIAAFNDDATHAEVMSLLNRARRELEEDQVQRLMRASKRRRCWR